ncbi:MAG: hypothetical protein KC417_11025, partial [Myxococcales bacterium]|nr:hypothetical protein [Myxococcales bacterium]
MTDASFSVDGSLARSTVSLNDAAAAVGGGEAADFTGASGATLGWLVARAAEKARVLAIVPDTNAARLLAEDVRAFLGERADELPPLVYPASEITPFVEIAPERRTQMDRLGVLDHLAEGRPFSVLVVPVAALLRRVPPPSSLAGRSLRVEVATSLDREAFLATLVRAGYTRTPVAEDPGTFAVRGSIIDVFPPRDPNPARIELDDDTVTAIKR